MDPFKKLEGKIFNLELLVLDLKFSNSNQFNKGRIIDIERAVQFTGLNNAVLNKAISKGKLPIYLFENDITNFLKQENGRAISLQQNELING